MCSFLPPEYIKPDAILSLALRGALACTDTKKIVFAHLLCYVI